MTNPLDCITNFIFAQRHIKPSDVILVPGGSQPELAQEAVKLYQQGLAPYILFSGGANVRLPTYSDEGDFLSQIALSLGVPEQAILREPNAQHTFQNAIFSWQVLQAKQIRVGRALLLCKHFHSRRALLTYQTCFPKGITFYLAPIIDKQDIRPDNWFLDPIKISKVMSEVSKIGQYFEKHIPNLVDKQSHLILTKVDGKSRASDTITTTRQHGNILSKLRRTPLNSLSRGEFPGLPS